MQDSPPPAPDAPDSRLSDAGGAGSSWRHRLRFRLVHLLYATALLAAALGALGPSGLVPGLMILAGWTLVFASRSRPRTLALLCLLLVAGLCVLSLLLPSVSTSRTATRQMRCSNNLKQIGLALYNYYDVHGSFPPPYLADASGRPLHSWRVLILPFLEQQSLYDAYDFDEPWDSPKNRRLSSQMPSVYACPNHARPRAGGQGGRLASTSYLAVQGPDTAWSVNPPRKFRDFLDGTSNTILVLEGDHDVHWMDPRDAGLEKGIWLLSSSAQGAPHRYENFFYVERRSRNACLADGSTASLSLPLDRELAGALLTLNDGRMLPMEEARQSRGTRQLRIDNCARLAVLAFLILLPLPWVWLGRRATVSRREP